MMAKVKNRKDIAPTSERMTATDTLNLNPAFISRVKKEEGFQQSTMAQKLRDDMNRMKDDELFPDMQFVCDGHLVPGHRLIIKSRLQNLTDANWYEISQGNLPVLHLCKSSPEDAKEFLKVLYTSDKVSSKFVIDTLKRSDRAEEDGTKVVEAADSSTACFETEPQVIQDEQILENNLSANVMLSSQVNTEQIQNSHVSQLAESDARLQSESVGNGIMCNVADHDIKIKPGTDKQVEITAASGSTYISNNADIVSSPFENQLPQIPADLEKNESGVKIYADSETVQNSSDQVQVDSIANEQHDCEDSHQALMSRKKCYELTIGHNDLESTAETVINVDTASVSNALQATSANSSSLQETSTNTDQVNGSASLHQHHGEEHSTHGKDMSEKSKEQDSQLNTEHPEGPSENEEDEVLSQVIYTPCSSLAEGLLQCYQWGDYTDCCLKVDGHKFLAHRCILASRCQYFEAMFAGSWTESEEMEIELHGVNARSMQYILLFLYGAMVEVPVADITFLMQASDMFGVEGLKDWTGFLIARDFCHFFHKPCQDCIRMVPDVLVLASQFNLTSLSERGKRWVATHFRRIWEMQNFGTLPPVLLDECTRAVIDQMNMQNITQMILDSHVLVRCLQRNHRAEPVQLAAVKVMDEALAFCAAQFPCLVRSPNFLSWSKDGAWCLDVLEESYTMVVSLLQPEAACEVYSSLRQLLATSETEEELGLDTSEEVRCLLKKLVERCEWYLQRYIHRVVQCPQWSQLPPDQQQQLLQKCSFVPAHAASSMGAKSRVAQKSAKVLQDNIVHTVTMLCETNPNLFPSLAQTRKILTNTSKQAPSRSSESKHEATSKDNRQKFVAKPQAVSKKKQKGTAAVGLRTGASESKISHTSSASRPGSGRSSETRNCSSSASSQASAGPKRSATVPATRPSSARNQEKDGSSSSHTVQQRTAVASSQSVSAFSVTHTAPQPKAAASSQSGSRPSLARGTAASREARAGVSGTTQKSGPEAKGGPQSAGTRPSSAQARVMSSQNSTQVLKQKEGAAKVLPSARPASACTKTTRAPSLHTRVSVSLSASSASPTSAHAKTTEPPLVSSSKPTSARTKPSETSTSSGRPASARTKATEPQAVPSSRPTLAYTKTTEPLSVSTPKPTSTRTKVTEHSSHTRVTEFPSASPITSKSTHTKATESSTVHAKAISKSSSKPAVGGAQPLSGPSSARSTKGVCGTTVKAPRPVSGIGKDSPSGVSVKTSRPASTVGRNSSNGAAVKTSRPAASIGKDSAKPQKQRSTQAVRKSDSKTVQTKDSVRTEEASRRSQLSELDRLARETENNTVDSETAAVLDIKDSDLGISAAGCAIAGDMEVSAPGEVAQENESSNPENRTVDSEVASVLDSDTRISVASAGVEKVKASEAVVQENKSSDPVVPEAEPTPELCHVENAQKTNRLEISVSVSVIETEAGETEQAQSTVQEVDADYDKNVSTIDDSSETVLTREAEDLLAQVFTDTTETEGIFVQVSEDKAEGISLLSAQVSKDKSKTEATLVQVSDNTEAEGILAHISEDKTKTQSIVSEDTTETEGILVQVSEDKTETGSVFTQAIAEDKTEAGVFTQGVAEDTTEASVFTQAIAEDTTEASVFTQDIAEDTTEASVFTQDIAEDTTEASVFTQDIAEDTTEASVFTQDIAEDTTEASVFTQDIAEDKTGAGVFTQDIAEDATEAEGISAQISEDKTEAQDLLAQELSEDKTEAEAQILEDKTEAQDILAQIAEDTTEAESISAQVSEEKPNAEDILISEDKTEVDGILAQVSD